MTDLEQLWAIGYDLDCGGCAFEELSVTSFTDALGVDLPLLAWDDPASGCFPFGDPRGLSKWFQTLLLISPSTDLPDWPESFEHEANYRAYHLRSSGEVFETDHDCTCHGRLVEWTGAAGEPAEPLNGKADWLEAEALEQELILEPGSPLPALTWELTGSAGDRPYPDCDRCRGDGSVVSPGGAYAWYEVESLEG